MKIFIVRGKLVKSGRWIKTEQTTKNTQGTNRKFA